MKRVLVLLLALVGLLLAVRNLTYILSTAGGIVAVLVAGTGVAALIYWQKREASHRDALQEILHPSDESDD